MATAIKAIPTLKGKEAEAFEREAARVEANPYTQDYTRETKAVRDYFQDFENDNMPCCLSEEELDKEIYLSMRSGNATQDEVNAVFNR